MIGRPLLFGDTLELAVWLDGTETPYMLEHYQREIMPDVILESARRHKILTAPPSFHVKRPGEDRVPPVPAWLEQRIADHGRRMVTIGMGIQEQAPILLVAEAKVVGRMPDFSARSFLADLNPDDLKNLRVVTKRAWLAQNPGAGPLTDSEADTIIDQHGPDAARDLILSQAGSVH